MRVLKAVWAAWRVIGHKVADVQARLLLSLFYYAILGPLALGVKLSSDPLRLRATATGAWLPRQANSPDRVGVGRRQF
jgi:hypothetical protein